MSAISPASGSRKPFHPHLGCVHFTQHLLFISAGAIFYPNVWAGLEKYNLGNPVRAAFESVPPVGFCMAFVTCSELPVCGYNLLNPRCKSWSAFSEPCEPKRKKALHINHQNTWSKEVGTMEQTHLIHSIKNCLWQQFSSYETDDQAGSLVVCRRSREGLVNKGA